MNEMNGCDDLDEFNLSFLNHLEPEWLGWSPNSQGWLSSLTGQLP